MDILEWMEEKQQKPKKRRSISECVSENWFAPALLGILCILMLLAGLLYTGLSNNIYFWDNATYWDISRAVAKGSLGENPVRAVYESIGTSDYNYVAALPSALWSLVFGPSRMAYVTGLIVMYLIPSAVLIYRLCKKLAKTAWSALLISVFMMPVTLYMALIGFVDVGGVLIGLACYNLYYSGDGITGKWHRYIIIGILLVTAMVFRRYFAFFAVSFITAMVADCLLFNAKWKNLITTCAVVGILLLTVFKPFLTGILLKDYGALYSGYKYTVSTDMKLITRYYGSIFLIIALAVPFVSAIRSKEYRPVFLWLQILVCAAMFITTQTHGQQHLLMYVPALTLVIIFMTNCVWNDWSKVFICAIATVNFLSPFVGREQPSNIQEIKSIAAIPTFSAMPETRTDILQILRIKNALDKTIPEGSVCSVLSSSFVLNDSILRNVEPSIGKKSVRDGNYIVALPEVDSRDYWRLNELYNAEYVLVANPAQLHLAPGEQTLVTEAVSSFVFDTDIAQLFSEVEGFDYNIGDVEVKLYKRDKVIDEIRKREFESRLYY